MTRDARGGLRHPSDRQLPTGAGSMTLQLAIEKAREGGYTTYPRGRLANHATMRRPNNLFIEFSDCSEIHVSALLIDPAFWQGLARALGWPASYKLAGEDHDGDRVAETQAAWLHQQHRLIDHLARGDTLDSFFADLR